MTICKCFEIMCISCIILIEILCVCIITIEICIIIRVCIVEIVIVVHSPRRECVNVDSIAQISTRLQDLISVIYAYLDEFCYDMLIYRRDLISSMCVSSRLCAGGYLTDSNSYAMLALLA